MKKLLIMFIALCMISACALCEESTEPQNEDTANFVHSLYDADDETVYDTAGVNRIDVSGLFTLDLPGDWVSYDLTDAQTEKGMFACFGDGRHYMFIGWNNDGSTYADATEYAMTLGMNDKYSSIFVSKMGDGEFTFYTDFEFMSSDCALVMSGKGVYTFYFYPLDGDREFAQKVIDTMGTFKFAEKEE